MARASSASIGFSSTWPSMTTVVSAPNTISSSASQAASALARARRRTYSTGSSPVRADFFDGFYAHGEMESGDR